MQGAPRAAAYALRSFPNSARGCSQNKEMSKSAVIVASATARHFARGLVVCRLAKLEQAA